MTQSIRIKRRWICELHSRRVSRVVVDRALLDADKDHDERRNIISPGPSRQVLAHIYPAYVRQPSAIDIVFKLVGRSPLISKSSVFTVIHPSKSYKRQIRPSLASSLGTLARIPCVSELYALHNCKYYRRSSHEIQRKKKRLNFSAVVALDDICIDRDMSKYHNVLEVVGQY